MTFLLVFPLFRFIDARDDRGATALVIAVSCRSAEVARLLLGSGADPRVSTDDGETALFRLAAWEPPDLDLCEVSDRKFSHQRAVHFRPSYEDVDREGYGRKQP